MTNRGIIPTILFENNAIYSKLSPPIISLESKATEDPGESLERKSLNWKWLNWSKRTQRNKMKRSSHDLLKDKEWVKRTSNDNENNESIDTRGSEG